MTMMVCVTSTGESLDDAIDPRFGRCAFFLFVDTDTLEYSAERNGFVELSGGAGIQAGQMVAQRGISAVLTGNVGPNAFQTLNEAGIDVYTGFQGTVRGALERFSREPSVPAGRPNVRSKSGM
jgi:predicted Fe-Mo cluster-binding NifX family protein